MIQTQNPTTAAAALDRDRCREDFPQPVKPHASRNLAERGITPNPITTWKDLA